MNNSPIPHNEKAKIIAELSKRNCSTDECWFKDRQTISEWVIRCTGKSITELLK